MPQDVPLNGRGRVPTLKEGASFLTWGVMRVFPIVLVFVPVLSFYQGGPPMITDDTGTTAKGKWELSLAYTRERSGGMAHHESPLFDISYGLSRNSELSLEFPW